MSGPRLDPLPAPSSRLGHAYTVDVYLHGPEAYPCTVCGQGRVPHDDCYCEPGLTCLPCSWTRLISREPSGIGRTIDAINECRRLVMALYGGNLDHPALDHLEAAMTAIKDVEP